MFDGGEPGDDPARLRQEADALARSNEPLSRPEDWLGYRLDPDQIEFWHGSPDRLHRRLLYTKADGRWTRPAPTALGLAVGPKSWAEPRKLYPM